MTDSTQTASNVLPFNMAPAPKLANRVTPPLDLSSAGPEWDYLTGWKVVIDLTVDLSTNDLIGVATDENETMRARNAALEEWLKKMVIAWNFVDNATGAPLPQPRDGGAALCPQDVFRAVTMVAANALQPKKA
jgi:hypothetical protein